MSIQHQNLMNIGLIGLSVIGEQYLCTVEDSILSFIIVPRTQRSRINARHSRHRRSRVRKGWAAFRDWLSDKQFRRYFRMSKILFKQLVDDVTSIIPSHNFKSEEYLQKIVESCVPTDPSNNIILAHHNSTGGFISGEIKLAIALRVLGGATYLDCALFFEVSFNHCHKLFKEVVCNWLCHPLFYPIDGIKYCLNDDEMNSVALQFSNSSRGVVNGCIGALDGWLVKIKKPTKRDGVDNPQSFYSRKGFYAINVQAICDKNKRVLFRSIMSRGAEHDSTAFRNSGLYKWLLNNYRSVAQKGYYFIGDSAYSLKSFLHTPYDFAVHGNREDNYNFFHSSSRITIECCFGEIDLRFGILWQALKYSLKFNCKVIDACFRMHNFIVQHRGGSVIDECDREIFNEDCRRFFAVNPDIREGIIGGESDARQGGRPQTLESNSSLLGKEWREKLCTEIYRQRLVRPKTNWYRDRNRVILN